MKDKEYFDLLLERQMLVEEFGDFNTLKECLDYLRQRVKILSGLLEESLDHLEPDFCNTLDERIKKVLESKNEIYEK